MCQQKLASTPQKSYFLKCFDWVLCRSFGKSRQVISFVQHLQSPTASTDPAIVCNLQSSQSLPSRPTLESVIGAGGLPCKPISHVNPTGQASCSSWPVKPNFGLNCTHKGEIQLLNTYHHFITYCSSGIFHTITSPAVLLSDTNFNYSFGCKHPCTLLWDR